MVNGSTGPIQRNRIKNKKINLSSLYINLESNIKFFTLTNEKYTNIREDNTE